MKLKAAIVLTTVSVSACGGVSAAYASRSLHAETIGSNATAWANYKTAGGKAGPAIKALETIGITCRIKGFKVSDGNVWWYRIGAEPWSNKFYVSADDFYNNGHTSGSLHGTPFFDPKVPTC